MCIDAVYANAEKILAGGWTASNAQVYTVKNSDDHEISSNFDSATFEPLHCVWLSCKKMIAKPLI